MKIFSTAEVVFQLRAVGIDIMDWDLRRLAGRLGIPQIGGRLIYDENAIELIISTIRDSPPKRKKPTV